MGMMNHSTTKPKLTRGPVVKVENQIKREDVIDDGTVTFTSSVRVDNHVRNKLTALLNIGLGDTQQEIINTLISDKVDVLDEASKKRFKDMYAILEKKDYLQASKK